MGFLFLGLIQLKRAAMYAHTRVSWWTGDLKDTILCLTNRKQKAQLSHKFDFTFGLNATFLLKWGSQGMM